MLYSYMKFILTRDAFDIHLNSEHYLSFNEEVTPWVSEKIVSQLTKQIV